MRKFFTNHWSWASFFVLWPICTLAVLAVFMLSSSAQTQPKFNPCAVPIGDEIENPTFHAVEGAFSNPAVAAVRFEFFPAGTDRVFNVQVKSKSLFTLAYDDADDTKDCWTIPFFDVPGIETGEKRDGTRYQSAVRLMDGIGITSLLSNPAQVFLFPRVAMPAPGYRVGR